MRPVGSAPAYDLDKDSCVASVATQVARAPARGLRRSGTESSSDSLLEGNGFELPVRGRGEAGCRAPFDAPGCLGRVGSRPSDPATAHGIVYEELPFRDGLGQTLQIGYPL